MQGVNLVLLGTLAGVILALVLLGPALRPAIIMSSAERGPERGGGCSALLGLLIFVALALFVVGAW